MRGLRLNLIQLPFYWGGKELSIPLGYLALASYLKNYGINSSIFDLVYLIKKGAISYSDDFFDISAKRICEYHSPNIIGFHALCSNLPLALLIAQKCKEIDPNLFIIFGGPDVSFEDTALLRSFKQIDLIVRGEGEITLLELMRALKGQKPLEGIKGITFRSKDAITRNPDRQLIRDLDSLPFLDYSLLPHLKEYKIGQFEGGRGCPFNCTFCSTSNMWGRNFRIKSPQRLCREIKYTHIHSQSNHASQIPISLLHDNFLAARKIASDFLDLMAGQNIFWDCSARLDCLDNSLIGKLEKAGCRSIFIGIETGSPRMQSIINKYLSIRRLPGILEALSNHNIHSALSFIIGLPGETVADLDLTFTCALRSKLYALQPTVQFELLSIVKGSDIYNQVRAALIKGSLLPTDIVPLENPPSAIINLIKEHPNIFSAFFYRKLSHFPGELLQKLSALFTFLSECFPLTSLYLLKRLDLKPYAFALILIDTFENDHIRWNYSLESNIFYKFYIPYFKLYLNTIALDKMIPGIFDHEELLEKASIRGDKEPIPIVTNISLGSRPYCFSKVKIEIFDFDVTSLIDKLRENNYQIETEPTSMVYVPGNPARAVKLESLTQGLMSLCNGRRSVAEIIKMGVDKELPPQKQKAARELIFSKLRFLAENGIITTNERKKNRDRKVKA